MEPPETRNTAEGVPRRSSDAPSINDHRHAHPGAFFGAVGDSLASVYLYDDPGSGAGLCVPPPTTQERDGRRKRRYKRVTPGARERACVAH